MCSQRLRARTRFIAVVAVMIAMMFCRNPVVLGGIWLTLIMPLCVYRSVGRSHLKLWLTFLLPISLGLLFIWGELVGAPPGSTPKSNPLAGIFYALTITARLAIATGLIQATYASMNSVRLVKELVWLGLKGDYLIIVLGSLVVLPEVRIRILQVYDAARARGFLHEPSLTRRLAITPYIIRSLFAWMITSSVERSKVWQERGIGVSEVLRVSTETTAEGFIRRVTGRNFSGRTATLEGVTCDTDCIYLGPEPANAISGLTMSVDEELELGQSSHSQDRPQVVEALGLSHLLKRNPLTLSGGEQALVSVGSAILSRPRTLAIDSTLEQLDELRKHKVVEALTADHSVTSKIYVVDNRQEELATLMRIPNEGPVAKIGGRLDIRPLKLNGRFGFVNQPCDIAVRDLSFEYDPGKPVLRGCSCELKSGNAYILRGPNGAGKTTFSKLLVGLLKPKTGSFSVNGRATDLWKAPAAVAAYHFQNPDAQLFNTSVLRELMSAFRAFRLPNDRDKVTELAEAFGISGVLDEHPLDLPYTLRKRVALAASLAMGRPWIILDEPTLGQDDDTADFIVQIAQSLMKQGIGFIIITHSQRFTAALSGTILQFDKGLMYPNSI